MQAKLERNTVAKPADFSLVASVSHPKAFIGGTRVFFEVEVAIIVRPTIHALALRSDFFMLARPVCPRLGFGVHDEVSMWTDSNG